MKIQKNNQQKKNKTNLKMRLTFLIAFVLVSNFSVAQSLDINPTPQQFMSEGSIEMPISFNIQQKNTDKATQHLLSSFFTTDNTDAKGFSIIIGDVDSKISRKLRRKVPGKAESYFIKSTKKSITIIGRDARGTYYGVRTLLALLQNKKMPLGEILDYPDVAARGTVEGFYGTPWSFEHRIRQIDFYGENKLNTYIYGPKDDPYHSSPNWRKPYPENEAAQLKKLIDRAEMNQVDFVWAIHPGKDIKWNDEDRKNLLNKFELMYDLGVRAYAVFFDDISGEGTNPKQQASLLNFLHTDFIKKKKDVKPLIMCPTEYNKGWSKPEGGYLKTLGKELDPSIRIMWTGNTVVADIDKETMNWINTEIDRNAFIWWNFPVSDYVRNHMLLGPTYGNGKDIANDVSGFVSNPMEHAEASKIAIYGVADYSWNMTEYQPEKKWLEALKVVMPKSYKALEVFARHNSDLGQNGHRYRRKESVSFSPKATAFLKQLKAGENIDNFKAVENEFHAMVEASYILLNSSDNAVLLDEIRPWVQQFKLLGQSGLGMLHMHTSLQAKQTDDFERSYNAIIAVKAEMYQIDRTKNQNPYQPGVKTATLVATPLIDDSFAYLTAAYNKEFNKNLAVASNYNPHLLFTNIKQLQNQQISLTDRTLVLNPPLEVIQIAANAYFGFELDKTTRVPNVQYQLENTSIYKKLELQTSTNGTTWATIKTEVKKDAIHVRVNKQVKYIRIINTSTENIETKIIHFKIEVK
ncbi:beta-N-acetylglucosaminidase [Polaribacter sp. 20A6]|uniref:beta-N-acetylglucosaminidase n=1 Tax=Polaribacter sp. 20A6 TaxID=2687289 RepID=UPI001F0E9E22|nr:beta-N-acetylglucosaminidase [Polaribacter sp. 20A6]